MEAFAAEPTFKAGHRRQAVLVGAPVIRGLAVGGEQGVLGILEILKRELHIAMGFAGVNDGRGARHQGLHRR